MFTDMDSRPYRQRKRREQQEQTRQRIVEATATLHAELGPAATTISAIAERAGVQRLTVYRHFPDEHALFGACSAHWFAAHPTPDPSAWAGISDPRARVEAACAALYPFYREGETTLEKVLHDAESIPALAEIMQPFRRSLAAVAERLAEGWGTAKRGRRQLRAAAAHAVAFETWRSFARQGLSDTESVAIMAAMMTGVATGGGWSPRPSSNRPRPTTGVPRAGAPATVASLTDRFR
jgi:AcrR family transcriptional regulator